MRTAPCQWWQTGRGRRAWGTYSVGIAGQKDKRAAHVKDKGSGYEVELEVDGNLALP